MNKLMKYTLMSLVLGLSQMGALTLQAQQIYSAGHGDIGIGFEGGNLEPHWHIGEDNESITLDGVPQTFGPSGTEREPNQIIAEGGQLQSRNAASAWSFVGVNSGENFYVFPQTQDPNQPFIGIGMEELVASEWDGDITLTLTGITGSGVTSGGFFSLYTEDAFNSPTQIMSSFEGGITATDALMQTPGTHTHYNWAFTELGTYNVTFEVSGTTSATPPAGASANTAVTPQSATYTFNVVPEPSTFALMLLAGVAFASRRRVK